MLASWKNAIPILTVVLVSAVLFNEQPTQAAPQAAHAKSPSNLASADAGLSIPDTTLAINSPSPLSQRIVHYQIEAKYDAIKRTVDATEILTYHNLTGQSLDH